MSTETKSWPGIRLTDGRFKILAELGEGGMGVIYRARDHRFVAEVVIKVPHARLLQDATFAERFQREAPSSVALSHANIVRIMDVSPDRSNWSRNANRLYDSGACEQRHWMGHGWRQRLVIHGNPTSLNILKLAISVWGKDSRT